MAAAFDTMRKIDCRTWPIQFFKNWNKESVLCTPY